MASVWRVSKKETEGGQEQGLGRQVELRFMVTEGRSEKL